MADLLYRLGRFSYSHRRPVAFIWLLLIAALGVGAATLGGSTVDSFSIPGTESQRALTALKTEFPAASGATGTIVVKAAPGTVLDQKDTKAVVRATVAKAEKVPGVVAVVDPYQANSISPTRTVALITVQFGRDAQNLSQPTKDGWDALASTSTPIRIMPGGGISDGITPGTGIGEVIGVAVAALVLVFTFGSLIAAGMTLVNALVGVVTGMAGLTLLAAVVDISSTAPILALMIGLAVGIDYSLFISSRHRSQVTHGMELGESIARATATAGSAVVFAGSTVIVALAGLSLVGVPFLGVMGLAAAATVLTAVLVALTLLPAMLGFLGHRVLPRNQSQQNQSQQDQPLAPSPGESLKAETALLERRFSYRWATMVVRFRIPVIIVGILALGVLSLPFKDMHLALPDSGTAAKGSDARMAYDTTAQAFGPGFNGPLLVVVNEPTAAATSSLAGQVVGTAQHLPGVALATLGGLSPKGTTALVRVVPTTGPSTTQTADLVKSLRDAIGPLTRSAGGTTAVTGSTAVGIDVSDKLMTALPLYLLVVVGLSFLLLMLAFRSLLVPLKATLGFLLTVGATFGTTVAIFQWGWAASWFGVDTPGPLVSFLPILMLGILFGLAMDYEVFIVSRVREEFTHGQSADRATVEGLAHGGRVVTAAALIMTAVFSGFMLSDSPIVKTIGFGLAFGVLVDAFVVRMTLVPAVLSVLGDAAWRIPGWLDRILPDLDLEGAGLRRKEFANNPPVPGDLAELSKRIG